MKTLIFALLLATSAAAHAATDFTASLTRDQNPGGAPTTDTGEPRPLSFGTAAFQLNDAQTALTMTVTVFNIDVTGTQTPDTNDDLVAAHIHAPAPPGDTAGVVWGFLGTPDNDNNPDNLVVTALAEGVGGMFSSVWNQPEGNNTTLTEQVPNLLAGLSYINFHTVQFPAGEIRGQIIPVPEPGALGLLGLGLLAIVARRRKTR